MHTSLRHRLAILLICVTLFTTTKPARADSLQTDADEIIIGIVLVSIAIGVGIYFLVRQPPSIKGCVVTNPNGLTLQNEGDQQTYTLTGDTAAIKSGDILKLSGKKEKKDSSGKRNFLVKKVARNYGACKVQPAAP